MSDRYRPPLILASQSPARQRLLEAAGFCFTAQPSHFDEDGIQEADPIVLVKTLAAKKAEVIAQRQQQPALVIGADSILYFNGAIQGKPDSPEEALDRWQAMRGGVGELFTGHALIDTYQGKSLCHYAVTRVFFAKPSDHEIQAYIATGEPLACAGCFAIDGYGGVWVEGIQGCHTNVIGLSMPLLGRMLTELGYTITDFWASKR
ncbi:MAG: nucleoside triphosphate pyrophosphatase [Cyanobacteriota bacterium]|nr:nucleoside triphosphate pyrophosphatase [Cyanobacteriota bacterium]